MCLGKVWGHIRVYTLLPFRKGHEEANGAMSYFKYTVTLKGVKAIRFEIKQRQTRPLNRQPAELTIQWVGHWVAQWVSTTLFWLLLKSISASWCRQFDSSLEEQRCGLICKMRMTLAPISIGCRALHESPISTAVVAAVVITAVWG